MNCWLDLSLRGPTSKENKGKKKEIEKETRAKGNKGMKREPEKGKRPRLLNSRFSLHHCLSGFCWKFGVLGRKIATCCPAYFFQPTTPLAFVTVSIGPLLSSLLTVLQLVTQCSDYRVFQKTDTQFYFWDNFGNSAPILTIFLLLQAEIYGT